MTAHADDAETVVDLLRHHRVERFLHAEAALLDDHRFTEWIELFTDDASYWIPTRHTRTNRDRAHEVSSRAGGAHAHDDMARLRGRVRRASSGMAWSEEPPSRTRRLLTNLRVRPRDDDGAVEATVNFWVYRSRLERHQDWFVGERCDVLRPADGEYSYRIADRAIVLDQSTILAPNIGVFL